MKTRLRWLFIYLITACDSPEPDLKLIFDGGWNWIETSGIESDGAPFYKEPDSEGYDWSFLFYDEQKTKGKLQTYKDEVKDVQYSYEYTISNDPLQQKLILINLQGGSGLPEIYYWEIAESNFYTHLYLKNVNYFSEECCNLKLVHHFVLQKD
ncbi:MAG: hypothetical protein JNN04_02785 [Cyclobacteriaceae bacterium]|nr:hypothetical protein [Cyclobacteriaceae bacterium]